MASTRQIKGRIRSVKSNKQITKAMEMVAASKLRHAQDTAQKSKHYTRASIEILNSLASLTDVESHELFKVREVKSRVIIAITSDRGLAGAYNSNVLRLLTQEIKKDREKGIKTSVIAIGKKCAHFATKLKDVDVIGVYDAGDKASREDIRPIISSFSNLYRSEQIDKVDIITTEFVNSFTQTARKFTLLPAGRNSITKDHETAISTELKEAKFEPSVTSVLDYIVRRLIEVGIYQAMLDSIASEHAMRRMAMKNASDNASDIIDDLTLEMNKVRQAGITQELSEISAGVEAMK